MSAEAFAHSRQDFLPKRVLTTRPKPRKKRRRENVDRYGFIDCRLHSPPAFAGILDETGISIETRICHESRRSKVEEPGGDDAAAPPHFSDIGDVEVEPLGLRQHVGPCVLEDVETLRVRLHQAILDPIVHHLHEMAGAVRPGMDVAAPDARVASVSAWGCRHVANSRREGAKDRVEAVDDLLFAADHHAVPALQTPHAAACSDVDVMQPALPKCRGPANIVLPERVAAVDEDIARLKQPTKLVDGVFCDFAGRQHQPYRSRLAELAHELFQSASRRSAFVGQSGDGLSLSIIDYRLVAMLHQATSNVAAHPPKSYDPDLHFERPLLPTLKRQGGQVGETLRNA